MYYVLNVLITLSPGLALSFCDPLEAGGKVTILRGVVEIHRPHGNMVSS